MKTPEIPKNEKERLAALRSYSILDSLPEQDYDNIVHIAAQITNMPISLVSLIDKDRQWFKAKKGIATTQTDRDVAFCAHAINRPDDIMIVNDARQDERFEQNALVSGDPPVVFYAGVPLKDNEGHALGTLCVIDTKPNDLSPEQAQSLRALSQQVMRLLELRRKTKNLEDTLESLEERNKQLDRFATVAAHDLKSPLNNISGFLDLLEDQYADQLDEEARDMIGLIGDSTKNLRSLVDGLLQFSRSEKLLKKDAETFDVGPLEKQMQDLHARGKKDVELSFSGSAESIKANKVVVELILRNLISNAIKYNDKPIAEIQVTIDEDEEKYHFQVKDNGPGIAPEYHERIFELFETVSDADRYGHRGTGMGLATVKKLLHKLGGSIKVTSKPGKGATFGFWLPKQFEE